MGYKFRSKFSNNVIESMMRKDPKYTVQSWSAVKLYLVKIFMHLLHLFSERPKPSRVNGRLNTGPRGWRGRAAPHQAPFQGRRKE